MVCVILTDWLRVRGLLKVILPGPTITQPGSPVVLEMLLIISRRSRPHLMLVASPHSWRFADSFAVDLGPERRSVVTEAKPV